MSNDDMVNIELMDFTPLRIILEGDRAFEEDVKGKFWQPGTLDAITILAKGMHSGKPSIALLVKNKDGTLTIAETSWSLLYTACRAFETRYGPGSVL